MAYKLVNMRFVLDLIYRTYHKLVISNIILNLRSSLFLFEPIQKRNQRYVAIRQAELLAEA